MKQDKILQGDVLEVLKTIPTESIDCCITSPPYLYITYSNIDMGVRNKKGQFINGIHYNTKTEFKKGYTYRTSQPYWNKEWLINQYIELGKSSKEIAMQFGCRDSNIQYFLKKFGIKTRSVSEARKIKHWGNSGEDNPMWNKRGELNPHWKGGITKERQAFYTSQEWKTCCLGVWKRDNAKCKRCEITEREGIPLHVHHIISFKAINLRSDETNLVLLCEVCHHWVHSKKNKNMEYVNKG
jgi:hypothetical protein